MQTKKKNRNGRRSSPSQINQERKANDFFMRKANYSIKGVGDFNQILFEMQNLIDDQPTVSLRVSGCNLYFVDRYSCPL